MSLLDTGARYEPVKVFMEQMTVDGDGKRTASGCSSDLQGLGLRSVGLRVQSLDRRRGRCSRAHRAGVHVPNRSIDYCGVIFCHLRQTFRLVSRSRPADAKPDKSLHPPGVLEHGAELGSPHRLVERLQMACSRYGLIRYRVVQHI